MLVQGETHTSVRRDDRMVIADNDQAIRTSSSRFPTRGRWLVGDNRLIEYFAADAV